MTRCEDCWSMNGLHRKWCPQSTQYDPATADADFAADMNSAEQYDGPMPSDAMADATEASRE